MKYDRTLKVFRIALTILALLVPILIVIKGFFLLPLFNIALIGLLGIGVILFIYESWEIEVRWRSISVSVLIIILSYLSKVVIYTIFAGQDFGLVDFLFIYWEFLWISIGHFYYINRIRAGESQNL
jgi:hypothetical protein